MARRPLLAALAALLAGAAWAPPARAFAHVAPGDTLADEELPTLDGRREHFLSPRAQANVFVFFRPNQDHSLATLKAMADCEREFAGKPVRWVAIVAADAPRDAVRATVREAGIRMPVLLDEGDALYGRLGVRLHPVIGIADGRLRLLDYVPFHKINYCDMVRVRIRRALGEADQAAVDKVDHPPKALQPNEIPGALARRHVKLGEMLLKSRLPAKAEENARTAIARSPDLPAAHALLGAALAAQGRCAEALPAFEEALRLEPGHAAAEAGRKGCAGKP